MQFYRRWSGRTLVFAGLTTALAMGIIGSCSRKIIVQSRVSALDARAQPYFNRARSNVPGVVKKLTTVGSLCRICWYMPRDKLTGSHKAQEYLSSVMKEPIMEPCRQGAQIYGCKLNSAGFLKSLKEINADYAVTKTYAVGGLALEAFFLKHTIAALGRVMSAAAVRLSVAYGGRSRSRCASGFGYFLGRPVMRLYKPQSSRRLKECKPSLRLFFTSYLNEFPTYDIRGNAIFFVQYPCSRFHRSRGL